MIQACFVPFSSGQMADFQDGMQNNLNYSLSNGLPIHMGKE